MRATSESAEWIFLATNLGLEMLSAACDQASSPRRPHYALFGMLLAIAAVLISIWELIYRGKKERVVLRKWGMLWWFYHPPPPRHTPFGTLPDIYGLVAGISQCICSIVQYVYCLWHADNPFKASLLPAIFLVCLGGSKLSNNRMNADTTDNKDSWENSSRQKTQAMNEYLSDLQQNHAQSDELDQSRAKPTHQSAFAAVAVAAETANSSAGSEPGLAVPETGPHRRLWVKDRKKDWWDKYNNPNVSDDEFREAFRMRKATFDMICEELDSAVTKKNTMLRDAIPVRQRVAVCIWRLATGEPLRLVSKRFGLGISTCHKLVLEVCSAIKTVLMPKFLQWPDENRMKAIKEEFEASSGIPNVGGSMYTTHVPIIAPKVNVAAYFNKRHTERNQKTSYSITVQGVVDPRGVFTDVCIGWPGSMPDDQVLEKSALFQRANRLLSSMPIFSLKDVWIVGNSGFPLTDGVLVPYTHQNLTWTQHAFNEKIGDVQRVAKDAFAKLKGRWSCLQKRTEVKLQDLPVVLGACCVLHNICAMRNEELDAKLSFDIFDDEIVPENSLRSATSVQARDHIAHNLLHHGLAGAAFL